MTSIKWEDFDSTGHTKIKDINHLDSVWVNDVTQQEVTVTDFGIFRGDGDWGDWQESQNPYLDAHGNNY
jgi:hypothetical protein